MDNCLKHYGTPRHSGRYPYGSGERPYQHNDIVFVSGTSKFEDKSSTYYRHDLPDSIKKKLDGYIRSGKKIIIGDAPGIDTAVQKYLAKKKYDNVVVYGTGKTRVNAGEWPEKIVDGTGYEEGSKEWHALKDKAMQEDSTRGLAVILENGGASATRKNIQALLERHKNVSIYELRGVEKDMLDRWIKMLDESNKYKTAKDLGDSKEFRDKLAKAIEKDFGNGKRLPKMTEMDYDKWVDVFDASFMANVEAIAKEYGYSYEDIAKNYSTYSDLYMDPYDFYKKHRR